MVCMNRKVADLVNLLEARELLSWGMESDTLLSSNTPSLEKASIDGTSLYAHSLVAEDSFAIL